MQDEQDSLAQIAKRLVWWKPPGTALTEKAMFLAQVMMFGTWEDIQAVRSIYGDEAFKKVLLEAPPGIFDMRSWSYWHGVYQIHPVPSLPQRRFP